MSNSGTCQTYFGPCQNLVTVRVKHILVRAKIWYVSNLFWYVSNSGTCQTYFGTCQNLVRVRIFLVRVKFRYMSNLFWYACQNVERVKLISLHVKIWYISNSFGTTEVGRHTYVPLNECSRHQKLCPKAENHKK